MNKQAGKETGIDNKDTREIILYDYCEDFSIQQSSADFTEISKQSLIDQLSFDDVAKLLEETIEESPESFLTFWATFIRIGNLVYLNKDGSLRIDNRSEQEVIDSLPSFEKKPFLLNHPEDSILVDSENCRKYLRGLTHTDPIYDRGLGRIRVTVTDREAIEAIKNTHTQISPGLTARVVKDAGDWYGAEFTHSQKKLRGNHLAGVVAGRAGKLVQSHIKLQDSEENFSIGLSDNILPLAVNTQEEYELRLEEESKENIETKEEPMTINKKEESNSNGQNQTTINFDGIDFSVSEPAAIAISQKIKTLEAESKKLQDNLDTSEKEIKNILDSQKDLEEKKAEVEKLFEKAESEIKALKDSLKPENIQKLIQPRVELETQARTVIGDSLDFSTEDDKSLKIKVVNKVYDEDILDSEDTAEEVDGAYRVALTQYKKQVENQKGNSEKSRTAVFDAYSTKPRADSRNNKPSEDDVYVVDDYNDVYEQQVARLKNNSTKPIGVHLK